MKSRNLLRTVISSSESRFFISQGHFKDASSAYIFRKFERILHAIYLITGHIDNKEEIKYKIRNLAVETLSLLSKISNKDDSFNTLMFRESLSNILSIESLLETMVITGLIKETGYAVVYGEIDVVAKSIFDKLKNADNFINLKDEILSLKNNDEINSKGHFEAKEYNKGQDVSFNKNNIFDKGQEQKESNFTEKSLNMEERKKTIIQFFKEKDKLTLKDISVLLPQYGEKTIQRELLSLVSVGMLDRVGKKRWTQYFLKKSD